VFAELDIDPTALIATEKLEFVTAESWEQPAESWITFYTVFLKRNTLRARGLEYFDAIRSDGDSPAVSNNPRINHPVEINAHCVLMH